MGLGHSPSIVTSGIVLCLDAANQKSYPGSGTTWTDLSGKSNNGTLINGPVFENNTLSFDGSNDYGTINESSSLKPTTAITVSAWIYPKASSYDNCRIIGDWHQTVSYDRWIFYANGTTITWYLGTTSTVEGGTTGITIVPNKWINLTGRFTGTSQDFFVDGKLYSQRSVTGTLRSGDGNRAIRFGQQGAYTGTTAAGGAFNGLISNIFLYDKSLNDAEIQQNFNALRGRYGL